MVEDQSGNQTVKCLGTYKPTTTQQVPPLQINKKVGIFLFMVFFICLYNIIGKIISVYNN